MLNNEEKGFASAHINCEEWANAKPSIKARK